MSYETKIIDLMTQKQVGYIDDKGNRHMLVVEATLDKMDKQVRDVFEGIADRDAMTAIVLDEGITNAPEIYRQAEQIARERGVDIIRGYYILKSGIDLAELDAHQED